MTDRFHRWRFCRRYRRMMARLTPGQRATVEARIAAHHTRVSAVMRASGVAIAEAAMTMGIATDPDPRDAGGG